MGPPDAWSDRGRRIRNSLPAVDEHSQSDGFMHETDGVTYAVDEQGDLLWFIPPSAYYRRRKGEAETAQPPDKPDL
jgi:hypothetical protein